jgi:hypothetical protein
MTDRTPGKLQSLHLLLFYSGGVHVIFMTILFS